MALPVGSASFAEGLVRGMQRRKAEDRQEVADQRQMEQDAMRKQEFDLQQQARTLGIENARNTAANNRTDRDRALGLQARGDAFNKHFGQAYAMAQAGDADGAINTLASGFNDPVFGMPLRAVPQVGPDGKPVKDKDGKYLIGYADGNGKLVRTDAWTLEDALSGFRGINDAASQFDRARESAAKAAEKKSAKLEKSATLKEQYDYQDRNNERQAARQLRLLRTKAAEGLAGSGRQSSASKDMLSASGLRYLSRNVSREDESGNPYTESVIDTRRLGEFQQWAKSKSLKPNDAALQVWLGEQPQTIAAPAATAPQEASLDFSELE